MKFRATRSMGIALITFVVISIFLLWGCAIIVFTNEGWNGTSLIFTFFSFFCMFMLVEVIRTRGRDFLSTIQFDKNGIRNLLTWREEIFIPWSECTSIGIGIFRGRRNTYYFIYFSKNISRLC